MPFVFPGEKRAPQYKDGMGQSSHPCAHTTTTGPHQLEHPLRRPTPSSISLQLSLGCRKCSALCAAMSGQPSTPRKARTRCACHTSESAPRGVALRLVLHAAHFSLGITASPSIATFFPTESCVKGRALALARRHATSPRVALQKPHGLERWNISLQVRWFHGVKK